MRQKIGVLGVAVAIALFAAPDGRAEDKPLKVALDGTFAPHAMPKLGGGVEGFNVDLANEIGLRLNRKMEITAAQWSGLLPALQERDLETFGEALYDLQHIVGTCFASAQGGVYAHKRLQEIVDRMREQGIDARTLDRWLTTCETARYAPGLAHEMESMRVEAARCIRDLEAQR